MNATQLAETGIDIEPIVTGQRLIYLPEKELHTKAASELAEAFARYFSYRADVCSAN